MSEWKKTQCSLCVLSCGLEVEVEDNKIISVRPDASSPRSKGYCCRKGRSIGKFVDHKERIDYPMKKVGDHFERISWEQALKEIAEKSNKILEEYGPRSCAMVGGATPGSQAEMVFMRALMSEIGTQYQYNAIGIEFMGSWWSHGKIFGDQMCFIEPDDDNCEVLMFWGSNSYVSGQILNAREKIKEASQNPDRMVVVVDPRLSETARMADLHVMLRPGTDSLFLRALIALILKNGWQNQSYIDKYVKDFEQAKNWYQDVDIEGSFNVCGIPFEKAEEFALLVSTKKWGVHMDLGMFMGRHNTLNCYLLLTLTVITGVALMPGGCIVNECAVNRGKNIDESDPKVWRTVETNRFPVLETYPSAVLSQELLSKKPEHLRMVFCSASNCARSYPDSENMVKGLERLDLLVVADVAWNETAELADYVLPVKTTFEGYDMNAFQMNYPEVVAQLKQPVLTKQIAERREGGQIWIDLAKAMGKMPAIPDKLYIAADKAAKTNDRMPFLIQLLLFAQKNKISNDFLPIVVGEILGKPMGSPTKALFYAALITSPIAGSKIPERAGLKPMGMHPILEKLGPLKGISIMDRAYQMMLDNPEGAVIGVVDPHEMIEHHVKHKDKKIHIYCDEIDSYIHKITPEQEAEDLSNTEYPMVVSAGKHTDFGVNWGMRNPAAYQYRTPGRMSINPEDAQRIGVKDGENARITTRAGSTILPVEYSYTTSPSYTMVPHHFGIKFDGKEIGTSVNKLIGADELDELTGNPFLRYTPCRIEKV